MSQHICLFGDSITWGAWDRKNGGWGSRLRRYIEENDYDIIVYNCGVSGDTTEELLKRFNIESEARQPNIILFAIGANDSYYYDSKDKPNVTVDRFKSNLQELVDQAKNFCSNIIFIGLTPVDENKTKPILWAPSIYHDQKNAKLYNNAIKEICKTNNAPFINLLDFVKTDDIEDGVHPSSKGHKKIFMKVKEFLLTEKLI